MSNAREVFTLKRFSLFIICIAIFAFAFSSQACAADVSQLRGPRIEKLLMLIISDPDAQVMAAEAGDVDLASDITRPSDIDRLGTNPNLRMSLARGMHAFFLLLNNNVAPWNDPAVRRAAAMSIDRSSIVRMIFSGYCEPINSWLPPVSPWALSDAARDIYDPEGAAALLESAGYGHDISGMLTMPDGTRFPEMKLLTPLARVAPTTAELAEIMADSLRAAGFPVEVEPMDFSAMIARLDRKDYSLAVLAWGMGRDPDSLYSFYHSEMDVEGGYNMTGVHDERLDAALYALRHAPDKAAAKTASDAAQRLLLEIMPSIPIYSRISVAAISDKWKNIFTTERMTADNMWTLIAAEPVDGTMRPFRMIIAEEPRNLNPFTASSAYSWQVLGMIYESLLTTDPNTLEDMPALAESWEIRTVHEGGDHTELTFRIKDGLRWNDGSPLSARDVAATINFIHEKRIPRFVDAVKDVVSVMAIDSHTVKVVMSGVSYWYLGNIGGLPTLPRAVIEKITDWQRWDPLADSETGGPLGLVGCGPFMLESYRPGEYVMMKRNPYYRLLPKGIAK